MSLALRSPDFQCCKPGKTLKATILDNLTVKQTWLAAGAFFFCVFLTLLIGGVGPVVTTSGSWTMSTPSGRSSVLLATLSGLSKWQQVTWLTVQLNRPTDLMGGPLANANMPVIFSLSWTFLSVTADGVTSFTNSSHVTQVFCPPRQATCNSFPVFSQILTGVGEYKVALQFNDPLAPWAGYAPLNPGVVYTLNQGLINPLYTQFEAGFKIFYCVISILLWALYCYSLYFGAGARDSEGNQLSSTHEQLWLLVLGVSLFFFNDPNFITYLSYPTYAGAGFSAFCTATFVSLLLFFFLCLVDNARMGGDTGFRWHTDGAARVKGALFWVPKTLLCCIIWAISLALYIFQRLSSIQDPSFTYVDYFGAFYVTVGANFVLGVGIVYILYLLVLTVLAFRAFKTSSPSSRFLLAISITALILTLVGLFSQAFSATRNTTILFLAAYGVPTVYIWTLLILLRPAPAPEAWSANTQGVLGGGGGGGSSLGGEGASGEEGDAAAAAAVAAAALSPSDFEALSPEARWKAFEAMRGRAARAGGVGGAGGGRAKKLLSGVGSGAEKEGEEEGGGKEGGGSGAGQSRKQLQGSATQQQQPPPPDFHPHAHHHVGEAEADEVEINVVGGKGWT